MPKYNKEELTKAVKESETIRQVLSKFDLRAAGGNYAHFKKWCKIWDIDFSHFPSSSELRKLRKIFHKEKQPIEEILTPNSTFSRGHLKIRLYREGFKDKKCEMCGQGEIWQNKQISLILDHINGVWNDNRLENLRILCPNCNATLPTHCGKNIVPKVKKPFIPRDTNQKIDWPDIETLINMLKEATFSEVSRKLGVSDSAIRKRILTRKKLDLTIPGIPLRKRLQLCP